MEGSVHGGEQTRRKMKTFRSTLNSMMLVVLVWQLGLFLQADAQIPDECLTSSTLRVPENTDINVTCGTQYMDLRIYICPIYNAQYNESLMVLNNQFKNPKCYGKADWTVTPPVLKFRFPINETSISDCGNNFQITSQVGTGEFADFSNVEFVNISGMVMSVDPSAGMITYRPQIHYIFSCKYPMQYLLNNTQLSVSGVNVAIRDNNGSFISTLSMELYQDANYQNLLTIPPTGLNLKTKIYVSVKATNLTEKFNLLLDRCYTTTGPYPMQTQYYDLFVGCTRDPQTKVEENGISQKAQFSFEAFRFIEHKNLTVSTFYLHCVTRLCEKSTCSSLLPVCSGQNRRRRAATDVPANATITSQQIRVGQESTDDEGTLASQTASSAESIASAFSSLLFSLLLAVCSTKYD
ncbi:zona pellucida-like domain-containing protein 1 isoform X1 [Poecilia formosa]|uniref:Zona pellucida-like domain-containing protein 1 n=1 Tax=Poecilia formosa TaxID=48698 RepID=A0A087XRN2_POEFO|nr:PREDICTED: zona pellucida-like domain-containing protein 1 isoform X1 [Poecilia formosa]